MKVSVLPVNKAFMDLFLTYVEEIESPHYTFVGTEGIGNATYVFECDEENPWLAVDGLKKAARRPPLGNVMFCQIKPYGMTTWPPLFDKDKYPRPEE